jgi:pectin methylesterase-like acyl-CoA thioesterase
MAAKALYMITRGAYFKSCTIKGTVDFIFGSARWLDGVGLEVDGALDGADLKYICSPLAGVDGEREKE